MSSIRKVIIDHDGGVDDLVAMALLCTMPESIEMIGCVVIDADCFVEDAFNVSGKLAATLCERAKVKPFPIARSSLMGVHEFPKDWRKDAYNMNDLPCVNHPDVLKAWAEKYNKFEAGKTGEQLMADLVMGSETKVTICVTGPLSNVAWCVEKYGDAFVSKVDDVVIMGGAVDVKGNVFVNKADGSAEWNLYWDAPAAKTVLDCAGFRKVLFALDATNHVPVTSEFVQRFGAQNDFFLSQFVGSSWAMCTHFIRLYGNDLGYYAWDALTAAFVMDPSLCELEALPLVVEVGKDAPDEGRTRRLGPAETPATSSIVHVARNTRAERFYEMVLEACRFV